MSVNIPGENKEQGLTQDRLEQFEKGSISLNDLSQTEKVGLEALARGEEIDLPPKAPADTAVKDGQAKEQGQSPVQDNKSTDSDEKPPKGFVDGLEYKKAKDAENTYRQRADTLSKKLEDIQAELAAARALSTVSVPSPLKSQDQVWDEKHQVDMAARVARLEAQSLQGVKGSEERLLKLQKELEEQKTFTEINGFASSYPELKLTRPFEDANAEYVQFTKKLGATPQDMSPVDRYFADADYRKEMESKGAKPPKDFDRLNLILEVFHRKNSKKYPNLDDAYLGHLRETNQLEKRFNGSYLKGVEDAVNKIANNKNETTILDPGKSNETGLKMTEAQMEAWLSTHRYPVTASERATMSQIQSYLEARSRDG